jgi:hypothetical protein
LKGFIVKKEPLPKFPKFYGVGMIFMAIALVLFLVPTIIVGLVKADVISPKQWPPGTGAMLLYSATAGMTLLYPSAVLGRFGADPEEFFSGSSGKAFVPMSVIFFILDILVLWGLGSTFSQTENADLSPVILQMRIDFLLLYGWVPAMSSLISMLFLATIYLYRSHYRKMKMLRSGKTR